MIFQLGGGGGVSVIFCYCPEVHWSLPSVTVPKGFCLIWRPIGQALIYYPDIRPHGSQNFFSSIILFIWIFFLCLLVNLAKILSILWFSQRHLLFLLIYLYCFCLFAFLLLFYPWVWLFLDIYYFWLLHFCCYSSTLMVVVKLLTWDISNFFISALNAMMSSLRITFIVLHTFGYIVFSFSFNNKTFQVSVWAHYLSNSELFTSHEFVDFLLFLLLITSSFHPWWSDRMQCTV